MIIFYSFLSYIIGIFSSQKIWLSSFFLLLILFIIFKYKKEKDKLKPTLFLICLFFTFGIIRPFLYLSGKEFNYDNLIGVVYKAENNYALIATLKGNYYIKESNLEVGDILSLSGKSELALFSHYENSFNFTSYLHHRFVDYKIEKPSINFLFKNPLRINSYKSYCLNFLESEEKILASSILFGDSLSELSSYDSLSKLGINRIFSTSGIHLTFFIQIIKEKYQGKKYYITIQKLELLFCLIFYFLTGFKFCFLRLIVEILLSIYLNYKSIFINRLLFISSTALIILSLNPYYIFEPGFIYSYLILFFLLLIPKKKYSLKFIQTITKSIYSFIIVLPINAFYYYEINALSLIFSTIIIPLGIAELLLCLPLLVFPYYGLILKYPLKIIYKILTFIANFKLIINCGKPSIIFLIIFYSLLIIICLTSFLKAKKIFKVSIIFSLLFCSTLFIPKFSFNDQITFIDVGQGDSTLLTFDNKHYLFDTGGNLHIDLAKSCLIPYFKKNKIRELEAVFITHRDFDHYGALESLKTKFPIKNIYDNYQIENFNYGNLNITNLNKFQEGKDTNYDSGVYYIETTKKNILIMGDAPIEIEAKLMKTYSDLNVDILKIGHHGSNTSSSFEFLKYINPKIAIISCGYKNYYGHPSESVIGNLNILKIPYKRTDQDFTIAYIL